MISFIRKAIIDTDFLLSLFNPVDVNNNKAVKILKKAQKDSLSVYILPTTICEFSLIAAGKIGKEEAKEAVKTVSGKDFILIDINEPFVKKGLEIFYKQTSRNESLFDCFVMSAVNQYKIDIIFSFDRGYKKNGYRLAEELYKN